MGLAAAVVPDDELMAFVNQKAQSLAALPLESLMQTKKLIMAPHLEAMKKAVHDEAMGLNKLVGGPANKEALAAFREKRDPDFSQL